MQQVSPADTTVRRLCAELCEFKLDDDRTHAVWTEATLKRCYIGCDS